MISVRATTDLNSPSYVAPENRIATFDQDGTLWVEHPIYTQAMFALDRVHELAARHPEWRTTEPFRSVLANDPKAIERFSERDWAELVFLTHAGMSQQDFLEIARAWIAKAQHPRFRRLFTELVYQPMMELIALLRSHQFDVFIVTGGGQDFVRAYAERVYGVPSQNVIGSSIATRYDVKDNKPELMRLPKIFFDNNNAGKPIGIDLFIGKRPCAAFGNSTGDRQMLEYTSAGSGTRLKVLIHHDDPVREYAYGPAGGLADTKVGTFTQALYDEANQQGWTVVSMKNDWKRVFTFEN